MPRLAWPARPPEVTAQARAEDAGDTRPVPASSGESSIAANAAYESTTHTFNGQWNGAEALAGNDGSALGPDGGAASDALFDTGVYRGTESTAAAGSG